MNQGNVNVQAPEGQLQVQQRGQNQAQTPPQFAVGILEAIEEGDEEDEIYTGDIFASIKK